MSTPAIKYSGPVISESVPWETRRHLQLLYEKLGNHTQAFQLQQQQISSIKGGSTTTIIEGGGSSPIPPSTGFLGQGLINDQTGSTGYATAQGDNGILLILNDASPVAVSLTTAAAPFYLFITNFGAGIATLTPSTGTISFPGNPGAASLTLPSGYSAMVSCDSTNWWADTFPTVPVSQTSVAHRWLDSYSASTGSFTTSQPSFSDISGVVAASQIPAPTASTLGGVESAGPTSHQWINEIDTTGVPHLSQPTAADVIPSSSTTSGRPTGIAVGFMDFDTTLGIPIWWNGTAWVNASGVAV